MKKSFVCLCLVFMGILIISSCGKKESETQVTKAAEKIESLSNDYAAYAALCDSFLTKVDNIDDNAMSMLKQKKDDISKNCNEVEDNYSFLSYSSLEFELKYKEFNNLTEEEKAGAARLISAIAKFNNTTDSCSKRVSKLQDVLLEKEINSIDTTFAEQEVDTTSIY